MLDVTASSFLNSTFLAIQIMGALQFQSVAVGKLTE